MDSPALSGAHNSRGSRSRPTYKNKNDDTGIGAFETDFNARATNGMAAVGARTMSGMTIVKMAPMAAEAETATRATAEAPGAARRARNGLRMTSPSRPPSQSWWCSARSCSG
jgi:hypothetical protein